MPVYCGALKVWRVLNLNTGTVYSMHFNSEKEAIASIQEGEIRAGATVKKVSIPQVCEIVDGILDGSTAELILACDDVDRKYKQNRHSRRKC